MLVMEKSLVDQNKISKRLKIRRLISSPGPQFIDEVPYGAFASLRADVLQPREDNLMDIVRFMVLSGNESESQVRMSCERMHPTWFTHWSVINMFDRSLRLPAGEIVAKVIREPDAIFGNPPKVVVNRWIRAITQYPEAEAYYIEPFFDFPDESHGTPLTAENLKLGVDDVWRSISAQAERLRWIIQTEEKLLYAFNRGCEVTSAVGLSVTKAWNRVFRPELERDLRMMINRARFRAKVLKDPTLSDLPWNDERAMRQLAAKMLKYEKLDPQTLIKPNDPSELAIASLLGSIVTGVSGELLIRPRRWDPVLALKLPNEGNTLRLVGHWDDYFVMENGKRVKKTFIHI